MNLAPIVLFVYNRPWHTEQTLNALMQNEWADQSILYIYSDGQKENAGKEEEEKIQEVRELIRSKEWCKEVHIIESERNKGLADSIIHGVTEVVNKYGKIIVLEDDIVTSKGFLKYMNDALALYQEEDRVMHISGYMYPHNSDLPETFFFNVPLCWGWATWKRAWKYLNEDSIDIYRKIEEINAWDLFDRFGGEYLSYQLKANIAGLLNTWFIKWYGSVFLFKGFTLFPGKSFVQNIGFDSSGTHNAKTTGYQHPLLAEKIKLSIQKLEENMDAEMIVKKFYNQQTIDENLKQKIHIRSHTGKIKNKFRGLIRKSFLKIYPELSNLKKLNEAAKQLNIGETIYGKNVKFYPPSHIYNSIIGCYSYVGDNGCVNNTVIGKFCSIGPNFFCGWGIHPLNGISTSPMFYSLRKQNGMTLSKSNKVLEQKKIFIGNDVFIGNNVIVLDGISIGHGAVIGAGSVVSKNIPPYAVAFGNPIQIRKYRFSEEEIQKFLQIQWWDYTEEKLQLVERDFFEVKNFLECQQEKY